MYSKEYEAHAIQRESGEGRTYAVMWKRYKKRVLLAMSSQAFAQLVCHLSTSCGSTILIKHVERYQW